jgi:GGDEF domain-containing protein/EAL domain-containing protein (putative c-di-GMP-specific phosphodiesterase class I)
MTKSSNHSVVQEAAGQSASAAGKMTVLGLDSIRQRMGAQWEKTSEKVHAFFMVLLQREMRPGDVVHKLGELSYIVIFRDLSVADAQLKCLTITDIVSRRLFGEETGAVSIRSVVGLVDNQLLLAGADLSSGVQAALEANGMETITTSNGVEVSRETAAPKREVPKAHVGSLLRRLEVSFGPDHDRLQPLVENQFSFKYRPVWDIARKVVLMYLCQPTSTMEAADLGPSVSAPGLCFAPERSEARCLDLLVLEEVAKRLDSIREKGARVLAACPIHFTTIAHSRNWAEYLSALQHLRAEVFRDIVFLVLGIDGGLPNIRLTQEIPKLSKRAKRVFVAVEYCDGLIPRFANTGIHAIGVELRRPQGSERQMLASVDALAREAQVLGIQSFVLGAKTRSTVVSTIGSGVRYLEGPAVSNPVAEPRHAFVQGIADLFRTPSDVAT